MDLGEQMTDVLLDSQAYIGIPLALIGAVLLSIGTQFQHRGVGKVEAARENTGTSALSAGQLKALLVRPSWVFGTLILGLAIVLQLTSLWFAPLIVVQPLGAFALVVTAIMNSRISKVALDAPTVRAVLTCVIGIGAFVTVAAFVAHQSPIDEQQLGAVLVILAALLAVWGLVFLFVRKRATPLVYVIAAGTLYGFVATLAKVVMGRVQTLIASEWKFGVAEWLTILCIVGLAVAALIGMYFVQAAHANGPPDLVVAGLTVVDPIVAVSIGIIVLGEARGAEWWQIALFIVTGAIAVWGVFQLSRHHPQMQSPLDTEALPFKRGSIKSKE